MRIVVVDGHTLNPGDLSWEPLGELGQYSVHDRSTPDELVERCRHADAVLTNKAVFDRTTLEALPSLRYVGVTATGVNCVDLAAAAERGVVVTNVPAYGTASVAQHAVALMLELASQVAHHAARVREGAWGDSGEFCTWDAPMTELAGRTLGIVGLGTIGLRVADVALALGMRVQATARGPLRSEGRAIAAVDMDTLFSTSDVVSLHCPLTDATEGLVDAARLATMRSDALLINTARGPLIDEAALDAALRAGRLGGAGLDVLRQEPPPDDHPLLSAPRCLVTSHLAWATLASRQRLMDGVIGNLRAFAAGQPIHAVT